MRLNIRMIGVLYDLVFLSIIGRTILRLLDNTTTRHSSSDDTENKGNPLAVLCDRHRPSLYWDISVIFSAN